MPDLRSTAIRHVEYRALRRALTVWFEGGRAYEYASVPFHLYEEFLLAPSKGAFFSRRIRGRFASRRHLPAWEDQPTPRRA